MHLAINESTSFLRDVMVCLNTYDGTAYGFSLFIEFYCTWERYMSSCLKELLDLNDLMPGGCCVRKGSGAIRMLRRVKKELLQMLESWMSNSFEVQLCTL